MAQTRVGIRNGALFNNNSTLWNDLLAYYTGDGTPDDALGNYNGTLTNGTTYGTGIINQGFSFDGVNDYVNLGNNLDFDGTTPFSVSCWANQTSTQLARVLSKGTNSPRYQFGTSATNKLVVFLANNAATNRLWVESNESTTNGVLQLLTYTYDGSKTSSGVKLYLDGVECTYNVIDSTLTGTLSNTNTLKIGGDLHYFNGIIDEVGVWDRVLTSSEVTELYNSGAGKQYPN